MLRHFFITITLIFICCFPNNNLLACECYQQSFQDESDKADLIFSGVAIEKKDSISIGKVFYTFRVAKTWKGQSPQNITIMTNFGGPACGATFEINKEYVVFSRNFGTSRCSRNSEVFLCSDIALLNYKYIASYKQNIGIDTSPFLSAAEGEYFNILFKKYTDTLYRMDFANKKVAFFVGGLLSKKRFFELYGTIAAPIGFEKFTTNEMQQSGGYNGIISLYRKMRFTKKKKKKLIKQLTT